jgi:hypothetical protein
VPDNESQPIQPTQHLSGSALSDLNRPEVRLLTLALRIPAISLDVSLRAPDLCEMTGFGTLSNVTVASLYELQRTVKFTLLAHHVDDERLEKW